MFFINIDCSSLTMVSSELSIVVKLALTYNVRRDTYIIVTAKRSASYEYPIFVHCIFRRIHVKGLAVKNKKNVPLKHRNAILSLTFSNEKDILQIRIINEAIYITVKFPCTLPIKYTKGDNNTADILITRAPGCNLNPPPNIPSLFFITTFFWQDFI